MFKNILVPHDGSELSRRGLEKAVLLAKAVGAKVTGFHVTPDIAASVRAYLPEAVYIGDDYQEQAAAVSREHLQEIEQVCAAAGVKCTTSYEVSEFIADAIVKAAQDHQCDLIAIASHGRMGLARVMLGSETQKVLAHANIPVLVVR